MLIAIKYALTEILFKIYKIKYFNQFFISLSTTKIIKTKDGIKMKTNI